MRYLSALRTLAGAAAMATALWHGFTAGDFFGEGSQLAAMPWGIVSLVDLYTGFVLFDEDVPEAIIREIEPDVEAAATASRPAASSTSAATARIRSAQPTLVPPNL